jgi:hypothetical protein
MRYHLSWENATGKKHPAFKIKELGKSLHFPLDFTGISFGDNDGWEILWFYFMLAKRFNQPEAALRAASYLPALAEPAPKKRTILDRTACADTLFAADFIPSTSSMDSLKKARKQKKNPSLGFLKVLIGLLLQMTQIFRLCA